jgi:hypothetical protein
MERWEYWYVVLQLRQKDPNDYSLNPEKVWTDGQAMAPHLTAMLDRYGQQGWELVNTHMLYDSLDNVACFFKRRKS